MLSHVEVLMERVVEHAKKALEAKEPEREEEIHMVIGYADAALDAMRNPDVTLVIAGEKFGPALKDGAETA